MNTILTPAYPFEARVRVESYLHGIRIDRFLSRHFRNYSVYRIQRMISAGLVYLDENRIDIDQRVHQGEEVRIRLLEPPDKLLASEELPVEILYEDSWIIVVDKPAGQVAHPVGVYQTGTLCNALQYHLDQQTALKGLLRPGIVHRLDRMTSGVMVITKDHISHRELSLDFQNSRVRKTYIALLQGELPHEKGLIDTPIGMHPGNGTILMSAGPDAVHARPAKTGYQVLQYIEGKTFVEVFPETGRNHQIRVHFASLGHPVVGDDYYGPFGTILRDPYDHGTPASDEEGEEEFSTNRHALHAASLEFEHPVTGNLLCVRTSLSREQLLAEFLNLGIE